jgi:hypothetical protein
MKQILLTLVVFTTALVQQASATVFQPGLGLGAVRTEIVNQQVIVSNAVTLDKPLATALRAALLQIDRTTPTNLVNDTKALQTITAKLNKTSLSNTFDPLIRATLLNYFGVVAGALNNASNTLAGTFPSGPHTAGDNLIATVFDSVEAALANVNTTLASKALAVVTKKLSQINSVVTKADNAPAPPARINARVTGSWGVSIKTQGAGIVGGAGLILNGAQQAGLGVRGIGFSTATVPEGTSTVAITAGAVTQLKFPGITTAYTMQGGDSGTVTVTRNNSNRTAYGTFTFTATGDQGTTGTVTVTGDFFGTF